MIDDIDIFGYNMGGSVSDMMRDPKLEREPITLPTGPQVANFAANFAPGAGSIDAGFGFPGMVDRDAGFVDIFSEDPGLSLPENYAEGNYGTALMQGLGVLGDAAYLGGPLLGGSVGSILKTPRAIQLAAKASKTKSGIAALDRTKQALPRLDADALDILEEINLSGGVQIDDMGNVTLYHRTTPAAASKIKETGVMTGKEDRLFFSTKPDGEISGYGSEVVEVKVPINKLQLDDIFENEVHLTLKTDFKPTNVNVISEIDEGVGKLQESLSKATDRKQYGLEDYLASQVPSKRLRNKSSDHPAKKLRAEIKEKRELRRSNSPAPNRLSSEEILNRKLNKFSEKKEANKILERVIEDNPNSQYWYKPDIEAITRDIMHSHGRPGDRFLDKSLVQANLKGLTRKFKNEGWSVDHVSKNRQGIVSSYYIEKGGERLRISTHDLPSTPQREYNRSIGLTGKWDEEVVITPRTNIDKEYNDLVGPAADDDIFGYNMGGSVSGIEDGGYLQGIKDFFAEQMQRKIERDMMMAEAQRAAIEEYAPSAGQLANFGGMLAPGMGIYDAKKGWPSMPDKDQPLSESYSGENSRTLLENIERGGFGGYFDASMQGLGVAGDAMYALPLIGAVTGPTIGTGLKAAGAAGKLIKSGIGALSRGGNKGVPTLIREYDARFDPRVREIDHLNNLNYDIATRSSANNPDALRLSDLEGEDFVTSMADRTRAGGVVLGIDDVPLYRAVDLRGGQGFMFENPNQVWASAQSPSKKILELAKTAKTKSGKDPLFIPWRMAPTGGDFSTTTGELMLGFAASNMNKATKKALDKAIRAYKTKGVMVEGKRVGAGLQIKGWKGVDDASSVEIWRNTPDSVRKELMNMMDVGFRNQGGLSIGAARLINTDPLQVMARDAGIQNVGRIAANQKITPSTHPSYPFAVPGEGIGSLPGAGQATIFEMLPGAQFGKAQKNVVDAANPTSRERRALQMKPYAGTITEKILRRMEDRGVDINSLTGLAPGALAFTLISGSLITPEEASAGGLVEIADALSIKETQGTNYAAGGVLEGVKDGSVDNIDIFEKGNADQGMYRLDGSIKSARGFIGPIKNLVTGGTMTEFSTDMNVGDTSVSIPTMVPTLSQEEIEYMQYMEPGKGWDMSNPITGRIIDKARAHARKRISDGMSPFYQDEEGMPSNLQKFADGGPVDNIDIFAYGGELTP